MSERIVFMGTPAFAVASLDALVQAGIDVAAVITAPDRPAGRGLRPKISAVSERAHALNLPVLKPADLRDPDFLAQLDRTSATLYLVVAFRKLPGEVFTRPRLGCVNLHASLLPDYRGAAPINWAVINGETRTGATTFFIEERIDTGDMILQQAIEIGPDETAGEVHDRLMQVGADLLVRTTQQILAEGVERITQSSVDRAAIHKAPKLTTALCQIHWDRPAQKVHDHVRGLSPFPGAWSSIEEAGTLQRIKVLRSRPGPANLTGAPGSVHVANGELLVQCGGGSLQLVEVQAEGRRRMDAAEFLRGLHGPAQMRFV